MEAEDTDLDRLQTVYKDAVNAWLEAIEAEKALVVVTPHSIAEVDKWEHAHDREEEAREAAKAAKEDYEDALREKFFGF